MTKHRRVCVAREEFCPLWGVELLAVFLSAFFCGAANADLAISNGQKIVPTDGATMDSFGGRLALDENTLVIGSEWHYSDGPGRGAAYIYRRNNGLWEFETQLYSNNGSPADNFGNAVAVDGSTVVVGDYQHSLSVPSGSYAGAAYIFERSVNGWTQVTITPDHPSNQGFFGRSVAIDENTVVVGKSRAAYIFEQVAGVWSQQQILLPSFPDGFDLGGGYGAAVALEDDVALVAASSQDAGATNSGAVFAYKKTNMGWEESDILLPQDPIFRGSFGASIDLSGDTAIIGRPHGVPTTSLMAGAAYVFERDGDNWIETGKLVASDGFAGDFFGINVAISRNLAAVSTGQRAEGTVYLFERSNGAWLEIGKLTTGLARNDDQFGVALAFDQDTLAIGAPLDNDIGATYVVNVPEPTMSSFIFAVLLFLPVRLNSKIWCRPGLQT